MDTGLVWEGWRLLSEGISLWLSVVVANVSIVLGYSIPGPWFSRPRLWSLPAAQENQLLADKEGNWESAEGKLFLTRCLRIFPCFSHLILPTIHPVGCLPLVEDRMERKWLVYGKIDSIWWRWGLNPSVADRRGLWVGRYLEKWISPAGLREWRQSFKSCKYLYLLMGEFPLTHRSKDRNGGS